MVFCLLTVLLFQAGRLKLWDMEEFDGSRLGIVEMEYVLQDEPLIENVGSSSAINTISLCS